MEFLGNPSHLASTKGWPKLRFASPLEQATVSRLTNTYAWFSFQSKVESEK